MNYYFLFLASPMYGTKREICFLVNCYLFMFSYICDDFVINDNAPGDIKILRMALDAVTNCDIGTLSRQKLGRRLLRYRAKNTKRFVIFWLLLCF